MSCSFAVLMSDARITAGEQVVLLSQAYPLDA
jgi:hypothetical protein